MGQPSITYHGVRLGTAVTCVQWFASGGLPDDLPERHELRNYSILFDWGRPSGGARQLALAILCHFFNPDGKGNSKIADSRALFFVDRFAQRFTYKIDKSSFTITTPEIRRHIDAIKQEGVHSHEASRGR